MEAFQKKNGKFVEDVDKGQTLCHTEEFRVRHGKTNTVGIEGELFRLNLLTVMSLNAFEKLKNWRLSIENDLGGAVLESLGGCIFLQSKHRKNKNVSITFDELFSVNSEETDFSLGKYYFLFQTIRSATSKFAVNEIILCSNADVALYSSELIHIVDKMEDNANSLLYHYGHDCFFYKFNHKALPKLEEHIKSYCKECLNENNVQVLTEDVLYFLKHLKLYFNYSIEAKLSINVEEFFLYMKYLREFCCRTSKYIQNKILNWPRQEIDGYLTDVHVKGILTQIRSDKYCEILKEYDVYFQREITLIDRKAAIVSDDGYLLITLQMYRSLQNRSEKGVLYVNSEEYIFQQAVDAFELPEYRVLVIICSGNYGALNAKNVSFKLIKILQECAYKTIILIGLSNNRLLRQITADHKISVMKLQVKFTDFSRETQTKLLKQNNCIFQGILNSLEEIFASRVTTEDLDKVLNTEILEKLIKREIIIIGSEIKPLDKSYYVHRKFKRVFEENDDVNDDIKIIRKFCKIKEKTFSEENIYDLDEKLILIADSPGTGKTTFLKKAEVDIKRRFPYLWVIRIQLNNFTKILKEIHDKNKTEMHIWELLNFTDATKLCNHIDKFIFSINKNVVLMLDGMDEVSPDYTDFILNLLLKCQESPNFIKIFVTLRSHMTIGLEDVFKIKSFRLQPFTKQNQMEFLTNYWIQNLTLPNAYKRKCEQYAETLLTKIALGNHLEREMSNNFTIAPLQIRLLAEIFQENYNQFNQHEDDWERCADYLRSNEERQPYLPECIDVTKIYGLFIDNKRHIFINKENPSKCKTIQQALTENFCEYLQYLRNLSIEIVLNKTKCKLFSCYHEPDRNGIPHVLKIGIVKEFVLIHRTFLEYFVAECLLDELKHEKQSVQFQKFFINEILYKPEYKTVRVLFDNKLNGYDNILSSHTFKNYQSTSFKIDSSEKCIPNLVHLLAKEGCVAILQMLFNCIKFGAATSSVVSISKTRYLRVLSLFSCKTLNSIKYLTKRGGVNIRDKEGMTPLHYAARHGQMQMVKFLVQEGANVNIKNNEETTALGEAVEGGKSLNIVKYLIDSGADINDSNSYYPLLHYAVRCNDLQMVKFLQKNGVDLNISSAVGITAVQLAILLHRDNIVRFLVEQGADLNFNDYQRYTAFHLATFRLSKYQSARPPCSSQCATPQKINKNHIENMYNYEVSYLQERLNFFYVDGDDVEEFKAASQLNIIKLLLKQGITINKIDYRGHTPLLKALIGGHMDIYNFLLPYSIDVDLTADQDLTELHKAVLNNNFHKIRSIITTGADVNVKRINGTTALHIAVAMQRLEIVQFLVENGADVNVKTQENNTALFVAVVTNQRETVRFLLEHGVYVHAVDVHSCIPILLASYLNFSDMIDVFMKNESVADFLLLFQMVSNAEKW